MTARSTTRSWAAASRPARSRTRIPRRSWWSPGSPSCGRTSAPGPTRSCAAAARVGDLHDLDAGGVTRSTPDEAATEVQRLLRAGAYKYLLIVGNDDAVPYFHVENPLVESEKAALADWELPADWLPSDNFYTDLDGDTYGGPGPAGRAHPEQRRR